MYHIFEEEFYIICAEIVSENLTIKQWAEIESCDMYQGGNYCGGFEAADMLFYFSVYIEKIEYWFGIGLIDVNEVLLKNKIGTEVERPPSNYLAVQSVNI